MKSCFSGLNTITNTVTGVPLSWPKELPMPILFWGSLIIVIVYEAPKP